MRAPCFGQLGADAQRRIQAGEWALQNQSNLAATDIAHLALGSAQQVASTKRQATGRFPALIAEQFQNGRRYCAFSRATLSDESKDFAAMDMEGHTSENVRLAGEIPTKIKRQHRR